MFSFVFVRNSAIDGFPPHAPPLKFCTMFGSVYSVLLMGMVPLWGTQAPAPVWPHVPTVAPPALESHRGVSRSPASLSASGAIVMDLDSGQVLFAQDADTARPMASLTKLMTALLIAEAHDLDEMVTVPSTIGDVEGTVAYLLPGERYSVGDLLSALLIASANDAAVTLARFHSGSSEAFVAEMNTRARILGLTHTSFHNPAGFDAPTQYSTPRELAWLATFVLRNPAIAQRMTWPSVRITGSRGTVLTLVTTHALLRTPPALPETDVVAYQADAAVVSIDASDRQTEPIVRAGKTGTTAGAGQCLLSIIEADGRRYVSVLLHSQDRYADARHVLAGLSQ